ncbi:hypothetical protein NHP190003_06890 [Helicobacter sp. NHP19-003]|uniref:Helicase HerA central domain-containing protein n=2 Tax=Helicobacter gastrocanis TaxID=2849641 RepID=A0ABN6I338_9HELI|nr:hypothetical protein NHP190003_06890 [Helicobacter sp. NHP19-003]
MTRTGKSNTIKIVIMAIEKLNEQRTQDQQIGQIIFDVNGEYTFANQQDQTCIYDKLQDKALRFSASARKVEEHEDVLVIQYDFYNNATLEESFGLLCDEIALLKQADYFKAFMGVSMFDREEYREREDQEEYNRKKRTNQRKRAIYKCILHRAKFGSAGYYKVYFHRFELTDGEQDKQDKARYKPHEGIPPEQACLYFENLDFNNLHDKYKQDKDYQALLTVLKATHVSGYEALMGLNHLHSHQGGDDYKKNHRSSTACGKGYIDRSLYCFHANARKIHQRTL